MRTPEDMNPKMTSELRQLLKQSKIDFENKQQMALKDPNKDGK